MRFIFKTRYEQDIDLAKHGGHRFWYGALVLALLAAPVLLEDYGLAQLTFVLIYGIVGLGLMLLAGFTGLFSIGHAAFLGVGAYTEAALVNAAAGSGRAPTPVVMWEERRYRVDVGAACRVEDDDVVAAEPGRDSYAEADWRQLGACGVGDGRHRVRWRRWRMRDHGKGPLQRPCHRGPA